MSARVKTFKLRVSYVLEDKIFVIVASDNYLSFVYIFYCFLKKVDGQWNIDTIIVAWILWSHVHNLVLKSMYLFYDPYYLLTISLAIDDICFLFSE